MGQEEHGRQLLVWPGVIAPVYGFWVHRPADVSLFPRRGFVTDNRMHSEAWFVRKRRIDNMNNVYMRKPCSCG